MLSERESELVLEKFFNECLRYWDTQNYDERDAFRLALEDIKRIKHDPYVPAGKPINLKAKENFIHYREMDLGRR